MLRRCIVKNRKRITNNYEELEGPGLEGVEDRETIGKIDNISMSNSKEGKREVVGQCFSYKDRVGMRNQARQRDIRAIIEVL